MKQIPYRAEYSTLILSDDVAKPEHGTAIVRYYLERLESHPQHREVQRVRAKRALESANQNRN